MLLLVALPSLYKTRFIVVRNTTRKALEIGEADRAAPYLTEVSLAIPAAVSLYQTIVTG
jgi:hypothetical protein